MTNKTKIFHSMTVWCVISAILLAIIAVLVMASVPPTSRDALTHHLAIPKLYIEHGGIYEIPWLKFSYYPMNLDMLYTIPLLWKKDIIPKYIHFLFAILTALMILEYLKVKVGFIFALMGVLLFLTIPVIIKLSVTTYVDLGLVFFSTASLLALFRWRDSLFQTKWLLLSAGMCGLALGTKYNGMVTFLILSLLVPFIYLRGSIDDSKTRLAMHQWHAVKNFFCFSAIALIVFSPWMIKNYVWTGNPIYPLYNGLLNPDNAVTSNNMSIFLKRHFLYGESFIEILTIPIRIFFQGEDDNPALFDGRLNPFLLFFSLCAIIKIKNGSSRLKNDILVFTLYSTIYVLVALFSTDMRIRYVAAIVPPLVILSILGIEKVFCLIQAHLTGYIVYIGKFCLSMLVVIMFFMNGQYMLNLARSVDPLTYLRGMVSRDQYIQKRRPEYAAMRYANQNLSEQAKILGIFIGSRGYYCDRSIIFDVNAVKVILLGANTLDDVATSFKAENYTHLLIRHDLFTNWLKLNFDNDKRKLMQDFINRKCIPLLSKGGYRLFKIKY